MVFVSMQAVRLFLRAVAVIKFVLQAANKKYRLQVASAFQIF